MKNITLIMVSIAILIFGSCNDEKKATPEVIEKTETIIIEKEVPVARKAAKAPKAAPAQDEKGNGTSISVSDKGVEFSKTNGANKTKIDLKKNGASIEIKK